ncbi:MAG: hypothetical protein M1127_00610 [Patescibacteria group bacterium]|nr:hypothetical protein [Patescibacteria group bacterium]
MNKKLYNRILRNTASYQEMFTNDLKDKEFARIYLEAAFGEYQKDGNTNALLLAMKDVAQAQGGVGKLAKKTTISREHLYDILASKHNPRLDNWLNIILGLGFRIRLESQDAVV